MGRIIDRLLDSMRLTDDDDDLFDEEEEEEEDDDFEERPLRKSLFKKVKDEDLYDATNSAVSKPRFSKPSKVVPMRTNGRNLEVCSIKPTKDDDGREICDVLLSGRAVVLNLEGINLQISQSIIDFVSGACYAMDGSIRKISDCIFLLSPSSVDVSGDFQDSMHDEL